MLPDFLNQRFQDACLSSLLGGVRYLGIYFRYYSNHNVSLREPIPIWSKYCLQFSVSRKLLEYLLQSKCQPIVSVVCLNTDLMMILYCFIYNYKSYSSDRAIFKMCMHAWQGTYIDTYTYIKELYSCQLSFLCSVTALTWRTTTIIELASSLGWVV